MALEIANDDGFDKWSLSFGIPRTNDVRTVKNRFKFFRSLERRSDHLFDYCNISHSTYYADKTLSWQHLSAALIFVISFKILRMERESYSALHN